MHEDNVAYRTSVVYMIVAVCFCLANLFPVTFTDPDPAVCVCVMQSLSAVSVCVFGQYHVFITDQCSSWFGWIITTAPMKTVVIDVISLHILMIFVICIELF